MLNKEFKTKFILWMIKWGYYWRSLTSWHSFLEVKEQFLKVSGSQTQLMLPLIVIIFLSPVGCLTLPGAIYIVKKTHKNSEKLDFKEIRQNCDKEFLLTSKF